MGMVCYEEIHCLSSSIHSKVGKLSFSYLGCLLGPRRDLKLCGVPLWRTLRGNFLCGKGIYSLGIRITLIKASLPNLSLYYMSLMWMLTVIREKLDRIRRDFLVGSAE